MPEMPWCCSVPLIVVVWLYVHLCRLVSRTNDKGRD